MTSGYHALTEKEKQALRLLLEGYDAKSMARQLGLSVHTIHERLRDARRKMATSSSREAARLLRELEHGTPHFVGDTPLGDAPGPAAAQGSPIGAKAGTSRRFAWMIGAIAMTLPLALLALSALYTSADAPASPAPTAQSAEAAPVTAALQWLALVDAQDWQGAYAAAGKSFRELNTVEGWSAAATSVRAQFGASSNRTLIGNEWVPAPPNGFQTVKFRTMTAKKGEVIEKLSLSEEDGTWKVVGIVID